MPNVTVAKAAQLIGKSRNVIYRAIESGKLSASVDKDGTKQIDTAELLRSFGAFTEQSTNETETGTRTQKRATTETAPSHALMMELGESRASIKYLEQMLADARTQIQRAEARASSAESRADSLLDLNQRLLVDLQKKARKPKS